MSEDVLVFLLCVGLFCCFIVGDLIGRTVTAQKRTPSGG